MESSSVPNSTSINTGLDLHLLQITGNIFDLIVQSLVFLFGVPGNCLILRIYWTKTVKTSAQVFIMGLAWADLVVCVMAVHRIYNAAAAMGSQNPPEFTYLIWAFEGIAIGTSIMMTAVVAADLYDCVCRPQRRFFIHQRSKIAAWAAFVFALIINVPAFIPKTSGPTARSMFLLQLAFQVLCFVVALVMIALCYSKVYMTIRNYTKVNTTRTVRESSVNGLVDKGSTTPQISAPTNIEPSIHTVSSRPKFIDELCLSMVANSNYPINESTLEESGKGRASNPHVLFAKETESRVENWNSNPKPQQHQGNNAGRAPPKADAAHLQRKTTRMLFITSVVFLLTWLPYWVRVAAVFASYNDLVFYMILGQLSVIFYVNNAVNPLIYGLANRRFRKDCKTALSKMKFC